MNVWTYHNKASSDAAEDLQNAYEQLKMATPGVTKSAPDDADDDMSVYGPTGSAHTLHGRNI